MYNKKVKIGSSSFILEDIMNKLSGLKQTVVVVEDFVVEHYSFLKVMVFLMINQQKEIVKIY